MQAITTIGLDIAKSVFQVHGVDAAGQVIIRRQLKRRYVLAFFHKLPPCLVGIEACASSHHWSREIKALGHTVRLMPPVYVKPYVKRQKNDAADAEAICEAVLMHGADPRLAAVAEACLSNIDDLRDHFGTVESEPRHPNVASGKPWAPEAGDLEPSGSTPTA